MKSIYVFLYLLFFVSSVIFLQNCDKAWAISYCPGCSLDGYLICNSFGHCDPFNARIKDGCVQTSDYTCSPCDPICKRSKVESKSNDIVFVSKDIKEIKIDPVYETTFSSINSITTDALFGNDIAQTKITGSFERESFPDNNYYMLYFYVNPKGTCKRSQEAIRTIYPLGKNSFIPQNGTVSVWFNSNGSRDYSKGKFNGACTVFGKENNAIQVTLSTDESEKVFVKLDIKGEETIKKQISATHQFYHLYIVWGNNLSDEKTMRVFVDNKEYISYSAELPDLTKEIFSIELSGSVYQEGRRRCRKVLWKKICTYHRKRANSYSAINDLKVWSEVVSEDPTYEFNQSQ